MGKIRKALVAFVFLSGSWAMAQSEPMQSEPAQSANPLQISLKGGSGTGLYSAAHFETFDFYKTEILGISFWTGFEFIQKTANYLQLPFMLQLNHHTPKWGSFGLGWGSFYGLAVANLPTASPVYDFGYRVAVNYKFPVAAQWLVSFSGHYDLGFCDLRPGHSKSAILALGLGFLF